MPLIVEISVAIASLAMVVIAVAAVLALSSVRKATDQVAKLAVDLQQWVGEANELTRKARETVASVRGVLAPVHRVAEGFEGLGDRAIKLCSVLLEEVETPIRTAVAVKRGVQSIATHFLERLTHRFLNGRSTTDGGSR